MLFSVLVACVCTLPSAGLGATDVSRWVQLGSPEDPFADRPDVVDCPTSSWAVETDPPSLELDTGACDYFALTQDLLVDLCAGDTIDVDVRHDGLEADEASVAHVALQIGQWLVLDQELEIPSDATVVQLTESAPEPLPAGTQVTLHLHNHGENTWNLLDLVARPGDAP